jgi:maltokinase
LALVDTAAGPEAYHLLVGYLPCGTAEPEALVGRTTLPGRGLVDVVDAPLSPIAMAACLGALAKTPPPRAVWFEDPPGPGQPTRVFSGEQSNTNVLIGDAVLFKLLRKLPGGPSQEAELLRTLGGTGLAPRLIGVLASPEAGCDLGLFCERIADAEDGWDWATAACAAERPVDAELEELGRVLRRLHRALAEAYGVSSLDPAEIAHRLAARLDLAAAQFEELRPLQDRLLRAACEGLGTAPLAAQRLHGDFHLGQTLLSPRGWTVIDFEGEPLKTPAERAAPDAVWRDVAGFLRSLDYARSRHADPSGRAAQSWREAARAAFLRGYQGGVGQPPAILRAYEIDKAVYELQYELRNRPDWAALPREALEAAVATAAAGS